jgi:hypothetical protein
MLSLTTLFHAICMFLFVPTENTQTPAFEEMNRVDDCTKLRYLSLLILLLTIMWGAFIHVLYTCFSDIFRECRYGSMRNETAYQSQDLTRDCNVVMYNTVTNIS